MPGGWCPVADFRVAVYPIADGSAHDCPVHDRCPVAVSELLFTRFLIAQLLIAQSVIARRAMAQLCMAQLCMAQLCMAQLVMTRFGTAKLTMAQPRKRSASTA
jgi:hypothetical protein